VQPDLVEHPTEIEKAADFFGWASQRNLGHKTRLNVLAHLSSERSTQILTLVVQAFKYCSGVHDGASMCCRSHHEGALF